MELVEVRIRLVASALILLHLSVSSFVFISVIQACRTAATIVPQVENLQDIILVVALMTAFIPFGCILFWGYRAMAVQIHRLFVNWQQYWLTIGKGAPNPTIRARATAEVSRLTKYLGAATTRPLTSVFSGKGEAGTALWMGAAFCAALSLAIAVLAVTGTHEKGISMALRLTGRLSFLLFWPAYAGGAMAVLLGRRFTILARYGHEFGLAFASAQLVHAALVVWLISNAPRPLLEGVMPFFAVGVAWTYVLAFSSVERLQHVFSPDLWRIFRNLGVEYIAFVFFADFVLGPIEGGVEHPIAYVPFSLLLIFGALIRMTALVRRSASGPWSRYFEHLPTRPDGD
jgi:hypothetical protein